MANETPIAGRLLSVSLNGNRIQCQQDGTMTFTANFSEDDPCKPSPDSLGGSIPFINRTPTSKDVSLTFSNKAFVTALQNTPEVWNNVDLINLFIEGDLEVDYVFANVILKDSKETHVVTYSGKGYLSSVTLNAPTEGNATTDIEIVGNGKPTQVITPVT